MSLPASLDAKPNASRDTVRAVLVEDDVDLRRVVQLTLQFGASWVVETAPDGASGVETVRRVQPDLVLVDLMMPGMDGYEVCRRLIADETTARIPIVLLTARQNLDPERVRESGARGFITKPFDLDALAPAILRLCQENDR
ncbi:MAG TPA: response regulator [Gemmatimonadaceae bacterium]|nr:response regulator [Gemmatimonadaceae bacterium]